VACVVGGSARYSHKETPMQKWYTNKYAEGFLVALITGTITAAMLAFTLLPENIERTKYISVVGIAFLTPLAALIRLLPNPLQVVQLVPGQSGERAQLVELPIVKGVVTPVAPLDPPRAEQSSDHVAAAVQRNAAGRFAPRVIPPAPPTA
jgi:energy-converting hydrogenase Eha subunit A